MISNTSCRPSTANRPEDREPGRPSGPANNLVVGIADCKVTADPELQLVTYALGSCIAVSLWDPVTKVGGMLHFMLPDSSVDLESGGRQNPYRYADTGTPLLFKTAYKHGAEKKRLVVRLAGGAAVVDSEGVFSIGKRNHTALRKILWKAGVAVQGEDVGGTHSRTVRMEIGSGRLVISNAGIGEKELPVPKGSGGGRLC